MSIKIAIFPHIVKIISKKIKKNVLAAPDARILVIVKWQNVRGRFVMETESKFL
jgi:hypothetical protein